MSFKKIFPVFFLLCTSIVYAAPKEQPAPPPTEQVAPEKQTPPVTEPENAPAPLPSSKEMTNSYEGAFVRMLVTLGGLVLLVVGTFWILRRLRGGKFSLGSGNTISVREKRALSPKTMLYVVEIGNTKVLISESQLEVRALTPFEEDIESGT
jgi:flagellar biogenesis protein FliO